MREGWRNVKIGELGVLLKGKGISRADLASDGVPCLRYGEIYSTYGSVTEHLVSRVENSRSNGALQLLPGDIVLAASGETAEEIGKAVAYIGREPGRVGGDTIVIRDHGQDPIFMGHLLNSPSVVRQKARLGKGQSVVHIHAPDIADIVVYLPPLPEQRKIAEILRTWDEALEKLTALRAAKARRYKAVARRFFDPCHPSHVQRGNDWREYELGKVFRERAEGGQPDDRLLSVTMNGGVLDRENVGRKDTSAADKSRYKLVLPGDIAYNTMRMWQGVAGFSSLRGIVSPAYTVVTPVETRILGRYAAHLFKSRRMVFDFERYSQGLTSDTWNLKFPAFAKIKVWLPPVATQERQADFLDALQHELTLLDAEIEALTRQKRGLMQKLLTGEWRVKVEAPVA